MNIAYWTTSSLEPEYEAVSKEVFLLARHFRRSWIFSTSPHLLARFSWRHRCLGLTVKAYPLLRLIVPALERAFDVSHVYGHVSPWLFHKTLHRRPIVHTVTESGDAPVTGFLERCSAIVVQTAATRDQLLSLGVPRERLYLWYPGVDLDTFRPRPREREATGPVRILFATAPRTLEEIDPRGVRLLLRTAALDKQRLRLRFLYRPWRTGYTSLDATRQAIRDLQLENVELTNSAVDAMHDLYPGHDFTVIPYTAPGGGKECPASALESLACGVPVLVSSMCRFSKFIEENRCGAVFEPSPESLLHAVRDASSRHAELSRNARRAAEAHLDVRALLKGYERLYQEANDTTEIHPTPSHEMPVPSEQ